MTIVWQPHGYFPFSLARATVNGCYVLKAVSSLGRDMLGFNQFEVMDPDGEISRFDDLSALENFLEDYR